MFYFVSCRGSPAGFLSSCAFKFAVQFICVLLFGRAAEVLPCRRVTTCFSQFPFSRWPSWNRREPGAAPDACALLPWRQWWHDAILLWRWWWWWWLAMCKRFKSRDLFKLRVLHWIMTQLRNRDGRMIGRWVLLMVRWMSCKKRERESR